MTQEVVIEVLDEHGVPVVDAAFEPVGGRAGTTRRSDDEGRIEVDASQPVAGLLSAPGKLSEPVVIAPTDADMRVVLFDRVGPGGVRLAYHFGGDVMLGRRYQNPQRSGTAEALDGEGAREVVSDLAPISAAADLTVVNVETVVGDLPGDVAAAGKRFLIQSPPQLVDALRELGVDAVTLGNNHANDWGDAGVLSTSAVLGPSGILHTGAGLTAQDAIRGLLLPVGDRLVGLISATSVDGDFVNDQLPRADTDVPGDLAAGDAWQYEERRFGFGAAGEPGYVAPGERRAGEAWRIFRELEPSLDEERGAELWAEITAPGAYPELQDWVARRGHGGAAGYSRSAVASEIARLRAAGAGTVVVQFHAGFQFAERPSSGLRQMSHDAIDDGADLVVSHHPHVLQGFEWYRGRLIAYSLGNLLFDQDFLATYPSAMLRVVVEGGQLLEARAIPVMLVDYRPVPVAASAAQRIVRMLDARSALPGVSRRVDGLRIGVVVDAEEEPHVVPAGVVFERNTGKIVAIGARTGSQVELVLEQGEPATLPPCQSLRADLLPGGVEYGVDLIGWGGFDDVTADGRRSAPMHWVERSRGDGRVIVAGESGAVADDALEIQAEANLSAFARLVSRAGIEQHRWYRADGQPLDAEPSYVLELDARRSAGANGTVRLDVYHVDDVDPTSDPVSTKIRTVEYPLEIEHPDDWNHLEIAIDPATFAPDANGRPADAVLVTFTTPPSLLQTFAFDNVRLLEWRSAPSVSQPIWVEADAVRADRDRTVAVTVAGCASG